MGIQVESPAKTLVYSFPVIFRAAGKPTRYPLFPIAHYKGGIACGAGWIPIIRELAEWLEAEARVVQAARKRAPVVTEIKSKFGTLCIHIKWFPPKLFFSDLAPRLRSASTKSATVCEICGAPGALRSDGWMRTRCDKCNVEKRRD